MTDTTPSGVPGTDRSSSWPRTSRHGRICGPRTASLALALTFRTQARPGDTRLGRAGFGWPAGALAALLTAGGVLLPAMGGMTALNVVGAVLLLYAAAAAAAFATAGRVRPHTLGHGRIVLRWGLRRSVEIPLTAVRRVEVAGRQDHRPSSSGFLVPGRAASALVLHLKDSVQVPARMGALRPVTTIVVPLSDAAAACRVWPTATPPARS
ncbi:hypothetical protein HRW07_10530 [Streptomyces lunaelactis]|uniref:hypothetical protein n=1 Tax=Streptomyces lunaelactis TaxID=1535768 RepID=UPI0015852B15|nr:hypothetical protein [Streptomyces lunaelactis]NUL03663.1 hypothetical protein [Streptomyces lunaelactis]